MGITAAVDSETLSVAVIDDLVPLASVLDTGASELICPGTIAVYHMCPERAEVSGVLCAEVSKRLASIVELAE